MDRVIVWFSCGAASAIALQLALEKYPRENYDVVPVYCNTSLDEHPSNALFMKAVEEWLGVQVTIIASEKYKSVEDVFEARRYMAGIKGVLVCLFRNWVDVPWREEVGLVPEP